MNEQRDSGSGPVCRVCGKDVPPSAARTAEGRDYNYFFCGEGCYQRWSAQQAVARERPERR